MPNPLAFSTLACPEWSIEEVVARAKAMGYDGLEWRGGPNGHLRPTASATERQAVRRWVADAGLKSLAVTAYSSFVSDDVGTRQANVDDLNRSADLAAEIGAGYIRAFLGELQDGQVPDETIIENIAACLEAAATYAQGLGVVIAVEPHDSFVRSTRVRPILAKVNHPALQVIWDMGNTFGAGESAAEGFEVLRPRLAYVQVKDGVGRGSNWTLGPVGKGQVPLAEIFGLLLGSGYIGAFSVEWERAWHPELDPAEVALPEALAVMKQLIRDSQTEGK
jgi:sugar phosphate isomerase/epimerase